MAKYAGPTLLLLTLAVLTLSVVGPALAGAADLTGQWYGTWESLEFPWYTSNFDLFIDQDNGYAIVNAPEYGLFYQSLPASVDGDDVTISAGGLILSGSVVGDPLAGIAWYFGFPIASWQASRYTGELFLPGLPPGSPCGDLPTPYCMGDAEECSELLPFDPDAGPGYIDALGNGESANNQYRSYIRRDLMLLVKHVAAKVDCKTAGWDYGNFAPLGLADMSEVDGAIPGTSIGMPGHPPGTHENGNDIDIAYYQLYAADNLPRPACLHYLGYVDEFRCVEEPYALDMWRTALFISYLSEHPHVRVIGVDGQVGLTLEYALHGLVSLGWIDPEHRSAIPLAYEVIDGGLGWFNHHHHHMHVSMNPVLDILSSVDLKPDTLNQNSKGKYITGYIEFVEGYDVGQVEIATVALILDGRTVLPAEVSHSTISDYNNNGISDLTLKFDRQLVLETIGAGTVEAAVTGAIDGEFFQGTDTIFVHD